MQDKVFPVNLISQISLGGQVLRFLNIRAPMDVEVNILRWWSSWRWPSWRLSGWRAGWRLSGGAPAGGFPGAPGGGPGAPGGGNPHGPSHRGWEGSWPNRKQSGQLN